MEVWHWWTWHCNSCSLKSADCFFNMSSWPSILLPHPLLVLFSVFPSSLFLSFLQLVSEFLIILLFFLAACSVLMLFLPPVHASIYIHAPYLFLEFANFHSCLFILLLSFCLTPIFATSILPFIVVIFCSFVEKCLQLIDYLFSPPKKYYRYII